MATAQFPKTAPWKPNPGGVRRSLEEAKAILARVGVELSDAVTIKVVKDDSTRVPAGAFAAYPVRSQGGRVTFDTVLEPKIDSVIVFVKESVFDSGEAIVAVLAHEQHEIDGLLDLIGREGAVPVERVQELLRAGNPGNLHDAAWDVADRLVARLRSTLP